MTDLRLVNDDLDADIAAAHVNARKAWAAVGAKIVMADVKHMTDSDRLRLVRQAEHESVTELEEALSKLALLIEKREEE